jgi:hypothetical protein
MYDWLIQIYVYMKAASSIMEECMQFEVQQKPCMLCILLW